jgi:hypothetical protein
MKTDSLEGLNKYLLLRHEHGFRSVIFICTTDNNPKGYDTAIRLINEFNKDYKFKLTVDIVEELNKYDRYKDTIILTELNKDNFRKFQRYLMMVNTFYPIIYVVVDSTKISKEILDKLVLTYCDIFVDNDLHFYRSKIDLSMDKVKFEPMFKYIPADIVVK